MDVFDVGQRGRKLVAVAENRARNPVSEFSRSIADGVATYGSGCAKDRKSTRLNSSHTVISYAVFCLKKKIDIIGAEKGTVLHDEARLRLGQCPAPIVAIESIQLQPHRQTATKHRHTDTRASQTNQSI